MPNAADHALMAEALRLARLGLYTAHPNPRVGCVIAVDGKPLGSGWHRRTGEAHAEIHALEMAGKAARGADVFVTLEPCAHHGRTPPCTDALIEAGVARVVVAQGDPNPRVAGEGLSRLIAAGIEVETGLLEAEARELNLGFISRMERRRPWVRVKLAMSLDGRTAMASGESRWISSEAAREDVQRLRARSGAVMTGIGTLLSDDPSLNVRLQPEALGLDQAPAQPTRVVLDTRLRTPPSARMLSLDGRVLVFTAVDDRDRYGLLEQAGAELVALPTAERGLDLSEVLTELGRREINEVQVEAGAGLAGGLVQAGLADELVLYVAPHLMGDGGRGLLHLPGLDHMRDRIELDVRDVRVVGSDLRITARPIYH
jgi:diaminohydroxyphosphoribosylaminopyrimidine deaminase/5-amino-6-(5-phosphoribosylamino)uracil reductase